MYRNRNDPVYLGLLTCFKNMHFTLFLIAELPPVVIIRICFIGNKNCIYDNRQLHRQIGYMAIKNLKKYVSESCMRSPKYSLVILYTLFHKLSIKNGYWISKLNTVREGNFEEGEHKV